MSAISALEARWFRSVFHASALSANSGQSPSASDAFPIQSVSPLSLLFTLYLAILSAFVLTFGMWGVAAHAQQPTGKIPRIGYLDSGSAADQETAAGRDAFLQGLRDLGYVEGKNINIEFRYDEGKRERLAELAEELVRVKVDILMAMDSNSARAAQESDGDDSNRLYDRRQSNDKRPRGELLRAGRQYYGGYDQLAGVSWQTARIVEGSYPQGFARRISDAHRLWVLQGNLR